MNLAMSYWDNPARKWRNGATKVWTRRFLLLIAVKIVERVTRIELVTEAWEAFVIPFHHTRGAAFITAVLRIGQAITGPFYGAMPFELAY